MYYTVYENRSTEINFLIAVDIVSLATASLVLGPLALEIVVPMLPPYARQAVIHSCVWDRLDQSGFSGEVLRFGGMTSSVSSRRREFCSSLRNKAD